MGEKGETLHLRHERLGAVRGALQAGLAAPQAAAKRAEEMEENRLEAPECGHEEKKKQFRERKSCQKEKLL